jgi:hypothetical protein
VVVSRLGEQGQQLDHMAVLAGHAHLSRHDLAYDFGFV